MSTAVVTPPKSNRVRTNPPHAGSMQPIKPHRWSLTEYRALGAAGMFQDLKTMLLNGELYIMPLPSPPHVASTRRIGKYLDGIFPTNPHVRLQDAFDIGTENDPGPDVAVVPGTFEDYETKHPSSAILIVEVSVSSLDTDLNVKAELYALAKVPEYWVVDVEGRELHVFRDPVTKPAGLGPNAYRSHQTISATDSVSPLAAPKALVKVEDLLPMAQTAPDA